MTTHELRSWPEQFGALWRGAKRAELRLNDRDYKLGDTLHLKEWEPGPGGAGAGDGGGYTGREMTVKVSHILSATDHVVGKLLAPDAVIMSVAVWARKEEER